MPLFFKTSRLLLSLTMTLTAFIAKAQDNSTKCTLYTNGHWFLTNSNGDIMGHPSAGADQAICGKMKATQNGNLVCSWNGHTYQVYNVNNGQGLGIQTPQHHFDDLNLCGATIKDQLPQSPFACAWNGNTYAPYNRFNNTALSSANVWDSYQDCVQHSAKASYGNLVCGWKEGAAYLYQSNGQIASPAFENIFDCGALVSIFKKSNLDASFSAKLLSQFNSKNKSAFKDGKPSEAVGFPSKKCEIKNHRFHLTQNDGTYLTQDCAPDTLYSWGNYQKLNWFFTNLPQGGNWSGKLEKSLFSVSSAAGTFGYGPLPIRLKIKPSVRFKVFVSPSVSTCEGFLSNGWVTQAELKNTIVSRVDVRADGISFLEHILCAKDVVESWSFGTQEHYDEVLRDHAWMTTQHYYQWEAYSKQNGVDLYVGNTLDSQFAYVNFSQDSLDTKLAFWRSLSLLGFGQVVTRAGDRNIDQHFKTNRPIYFNPD